MDGIGREIAAVIADIRADAPTELMPDTYAITRGTTRVPDGSGGYTETPTVVETGPCRLSPSQRLSVEGLQGGVLTATGPYTLHLPLDTTITASDTVEVNGRPFAVTGAPKRGGEWAIDVSVPVEEAS